MGSRSRLAALVTGIALAVVGLASPTTAAAGYCSSYTSGSLTTSTCFGDDGSSAYGSSYQTGAYTTGNYYGSDSSGRPWSVSTSSYDANNDRPTTIYLPTSP